MKSDRREYFKKRYLERYKKTYIPKPDLRPHIMVNLEPLQTIWEFERELYLEAQRSKRYLYFLLRDSKNPLPPVKSLVGKKCFVFHGGYVRGYHFVVGLEKRFGFRCEVTGRLFHPGWYLVWASEFNELNLHFGRLGFPRANFFYSSDIG